MRTNSSRTKIAIVTFHDANNYGAFLQAIGLKRFFEQNGYIVDFLSLTNGSKVKEWLRQVKRRIKGKQVETKASRNLKKQYNRMFRQYAEKHLTTVAINKISDLHAISKKYVRIIVGSDQIWNTHMNLLSGENLRFFFLDTNLYCKRIGYAASFGVSNQLEEKRVLFAPLLKQFDAISVRDDFSRDIVASTGCNPPIVVCDPTLIHEYSDIIEKPSIFDQLPAKYIFTYCLNKENESDYVQILSNLKQKLKLPILSITSFGHTKWELIGCDNYIRTATPGEWVYLLANAQFVFTDSFHGTIFSLKYRRPFLTYSHQSTRGDRTKDLAKRYKFESHLVSKDSLSSELIKTSVQDLEITYTLMKEHQKISVEWLLAHGVNFI